MSLKAFAAITFINTGLSSLLFPTFSAISFSCERCTYNLSQDFSPSTLIVSAAVFVVPLYRYSGGIVRWFDVYTGIECP